MTANTNINPLVKQRILNGISRVIWVEAWRKAHAEDGWILPDGVTAWDQAPRDVPKQATIVAKVLAKKVETANAADLVSLLRSELVNRKIIDEKSTANDQQRVLMQWAEDYGVGIGRKAIKETITGWDSGDGIVARIPEIEVTSTARYKVGALVIE